MLEQRSDSELVVAARGDDPDAYGQLFERWFDRAWNVARTIVRNDDLAADVAQDAIIGAWQRLDQLDDPDAFGGWLLRSTRNRALNRLAREGRSRATGDEVVSGLRDGGLDDPVGAERQPEPDAVSEIRDRQELVWAAATALGERDISLLDLHLRHGLTPAEIADELGVEANAAHQQLFRLRGRLGDAIGSYLLWRNGQPLCDGLADAVSGQHAFDRSVARAVARHQKRCEHCAEERGRLVDPAKLFAAVPLLLAPPHLKAQAAAALDAAGVPRGGEGHSPDGSESHSPDGGDGHSADGGGEAGPVDNGADPTRADGAQADGGQASRFDGADGRGTDSTSNGAGSDASTGTGSTPDASGPSGTTPDGSSGGGAGPDGSGGSSGTGVAPDGSGASTGPTGSGGGAGPAGPAPAPTPLPPTVQPIVVPPPAPVASAAPGPHVLSTEAEAPGPAGGATGGPSPIVLTSAMSRPRFLAIAGTGVVAVVALVGLGYLALGDRGPGTDVAAIGSDASQVVAPPASQSGADDADDPAGPASFSPSAADDTDGDDAGPPTAGPSSATTSPATSPTTEASTTETTATTTGSSATTPTTVDTTDTTPTTDTTDTTPTTGTTRDTTGTTPTTGTTRDTTGTTPTTGTTRTTPTTGTTTGTTPTTAADPPVIVRFTSRLGGNNRICADDAQRPYEAIWATEHTTSVTLTLPNGTHRGGASGTHAFCGSRGDRIGLVAVGPGGEDKATTNL